MVVEFFIQLNDIFESEFIINDVYVESDDEIQFYDDFDFFDFLFLYGEEQSINLKIEREYLFDIFNEEDLFDCLNEIIYIQMDDCIYIEDFDEENLLQFFF